MSVNVIIPYSYKDLLLRLSPDTAGVVLAALARAQFVRYDHTLRGYVCEDEQNVTLNIVPDTAIGPVTTTAIEEYKALTDPAPIAPASSIDEEIPF